MGDKNNNNASGGKEKRKQLYKCVHRREPNVRPKWEQEQYILQVNGRSTWKNIPCWLRVLFAVKTVNNKFLFALCLFDPSALDVFDLLWMGYM